MYTSKQTNWLKHMDFLVLDFAVVEFIFAAADVYRNGSGHLFKSQIYIGVGFVILLCYACVAFFTESYHGIMRRGRIAELKSVMKQILLTFSLVVCFIFVIGYGRDFSRVVFFVGLIASVPCVWGVRCAHKASVRRHMMLPKSNLLVVTSHDIAEAVIANIERDSYGLYNIIGIVLNDTDEYVHQHILGYEVLCQGKEFYNYIQNKWVDAVFVSVSKGNVIPERFYTNCAEMGITVHLKLADIGEMPQNLVVEKIGGYVVLTKAMKVATFRQIFLKRLTDILGSVIGLILTGIFTVIIGPMIYFTSPGPIFYSQIRIGKNGRPFRMYKFRSMVVNADDLKKQLADKNKMNGQMFKIDADPRIIGSGPDGTKHGIGWFIRRYSIDEFPQFLNVLAGDMSLVGTRPPTEEEWNNYEMHHRARLSVKPGLTGLWQISGRSDLTDFEEVVKLDTEYIENWNLGEDIKILVKTIAIVLRGNGAE